MHWHSVVLAYHWTREKRVTARPLASAFTCLKNSSLGALLFVPSDFIMRFHNGSAYFNERTQPKSYMQLETILCYLKLLLLFGGIM